MWPSCNHLCMCVCLAQHENRPANGIAALTLDAIGHIQALLYRLQSYNWDTGNPSSSKSLGHKIVVVSTSYNSGTSQAAPRANGML